MPEVQRISSRDNPLLVKVRKLAHDPVAYRKMIADENPYGDGRAAERITSVLEQHLSA